MEPQTLVTTPGPRGGTVRTEAGEILTVPAGWELLPPGDAALTRRVKAAGPTWTMQEKRGRKVFSRGLWADAAVIAALRTALEAERGTEAYARKLATGQRRRAREQSEYVENFEQAVLRYLDFAPSHAELAGRLAQAVTRHATPVGSGTVARTERLPLDQRAEMAVIAWLRHQTTTYDQMTIPRVRGKRREVRRALAGQSRRLLQRYRQGEPIDAHTCPLWRALAPREAAS